MRLFIALPLPENVKDELARIIDGFRRHRAKVKWVEAKNIHLTLKFLGETDEELVPSISEGIQKVASDYEPVGAELDSLGGFPNLRRPRVLWAGFSESPEILAKIARKIDHEMRPLGFEKEKRKFKSHLTIGRVRDPRMIGDLPEAVEAYRMDPQDVLFDRIILYKSTLTPRGPIYDKLSVAPLKKE